MDPFCGSGMSAIEALRANRKAICFDLNPLSSFFIEVYTSDFDHDSFKKVALEIVAGVRDDEYYKKLWEYDGIIHNVKYDKNEIYEVCLSEYKKHKFKNSTRRARTQQDLEALLFAKTINLQKLGLNYIDEKFLDSDSFTANFIEKIGGNNFKFIWTERNLYALSLLFSKILEVKDENIKKFLVFGFLMTTHLCCKMNIPRREQACRNFSTSWGRSAYVCSSRQMEQNPLIVFYHSCFGKQSVESALKCANTYIDKSKIKLKRVTYADKRKLDNAFSLKYGSVNVLTLADYVGENSVDFILTDPPYGGLVQYFDLSYLWLVWLKKYDVKFGEIDFNGEITINKKFDLKNYGIRFTNALKQLHRVLKDGGKMVITFHNKNIQIWNCFIRSLQDAGFIIEKVIHQKNRRSGESVVANPYGTSGTDFYIRCIKRIASLDKSKSLDNLNEMIVKIGIRAISARNEPTPFVILFDAILAEITSSGYIFSHDCDGDIKKALSAEIGKTFIITDRGKATKADRLWWLKEPHKHISLYHVPLSDRVDKVILYELKTKALITPDDALAAIYKNFPNGLTPTESSIQASLKKFALKSSGGYVYNKNAEGVLQATKHTEYIYYIGNIGKKLGYKIYVGKREQPEKITIKGQEIHLRSICDVLNLQEVLNLNQEEYFVSRAEMIDLIFIKNNKIKCIFEVENSTNIVTALHRASVLDDNVDKIIVIPDARKNELLRLKDTLTRKVIKDHNWKYITYSDVDNLNHTKNPNLATYLKAIDG
ncbi:hypothetical protein SNTW_10650 [Helicobacter suis]|uniref:site-specific DNA-methyltransferase (adenine-specific) n=2 Tax=Helicobacter suis TaxID=104628 RepID=A0A6J4D0V2_9HELI|nr:hypothetical protein SNTW_10650 [Helicobacter suis]